MAEISTKPYMIRAIHEWCSDNGYTPYMLVKVGGRARVPMQHVQNGEIVLNTSLMATNALHMDNDFIRFEARFNGVPEHIIVPVGNVAAIYARETGSGMAFEPEL
ncbi:MAG: ClpXP protease specificity-enhancing factor, partial [Lautropia sp.]|nr:ClpXP protease specificity-enhancing factor [Lautropia sp.]